MRRSKALSALLLLAAGTSAAADRGYVAYTAPGNVFTCEIPKGWQAFGSETPFGSSVHVLGPAEEKGAWRAAIHVHFFQKSKPGFVPFDAMLKRERTPDVTTHRQATVVTRWRVSRGSGRRFDVTETRLLPPDILPAKPVVLHHYYAMVPAGDGYFVIKLSSTQEDYQRHRDDFDHLLSTFLITGY